MKYYRLCVILVIVCACSNPKKENLSTNLIQQTSGSAQDVPKLNDSSNPDSFSELLVDQKMLNMIVISIPCTFKPMNEEILALKYTWKQGTTFEAYTNEEATVNIACEYMRNKATLQDLPAIKQVFEQQFNRPGITFKRAEIEIINARKFIVLEMITPAIDTEVYNLMFITSLADKLLIGTFNCTVDKMEKWQPIAKKILSSVRIKG